MLESWWTPARPFILPDAILFRSFFKRHPSDFSTREIEKNTILAFHERKDPVKGLTAHLSCSAFIFTPSVKKIKSFFILS